MKSLKLNSQSRSSEIGATTLETAIGLLFLFGVLVGIFDLGIVLHRYTIFSEVVEHTTEQNGIALANLQTDSSLSCNGSGSELSTNVINTARDDLQQRFGITGTFSDVSGDSSANFLLLSNVDFNTTGTQFNTLTVRGEMPVECIFCHLFPKVMRVGTTSRVLVENINLGTECF